MQIDNFERIKPLFYFNEANGIFFHVQLVRRAKDFKPIVVKEKTIQSFFVRSRNELEEMKPGIIALCEQYGARAYINVGGKDFSELNKQMLLKLAEYNALDQVVNTVKILNSVAGALKSRVDRWVIDVDNNSIELWNDLRDFLGSEGLSESNWHIIPTVHGYHVILRKKINTNKFGIAFDSLSIHKNSMGTLLYCPDFENRENKENETSL